MGAVVEQESARTRRNYARAFPTDVIWTTDATGEIVEDCPSWREFTGQSPDEILGYGWLDAVHPDDRPGIKHRRTLASVPGSIFETDFRIRRLDGEWRHMTVRGVPVRAKNGEVSQWVGFCHDVTEQADYTELLFRERNFADILIESLPGILYVVDEAGHVLRWNRNAEVISDYSPEEIAQMFGFEFVPTQDRDDVAAARKRLIKAGGYEEREMEYLTKSGERIPFCVGGRRILFNGKRCVIGIGLDISELKNTEKKLLELNAELEDRVKERTTQLEQSNKELEAFSYSVSHDLKSPLFAIRGFAEALKEDYGTELAGEGQEFVERILQAGERMARLIEDVLRYSRIGYVGLKLRAVSLTELIHRVGADFELQLKGIGGSLEIAENLPVVNGDPTLLVQTFSNLFQNAINYRRRDVPLKVKVDCRCDDGAVVVLVSDNGVGIAPENWGKVFEAFQRLRTDQQIPGSGLGLATVKRAVEAMGGAVWLESEVESGTTFFVRLKAAG